MVKRDIRQSIRCRSNNVYRCISGLENVNEYLHISEF